MIQSIKWDVTPQLIDGYSVPNLYGLLFVTGLIIGYFVVRKMYKAEGLGEDKLDKLVMYMILATIIGARLGHVFFYGPYFDTVAADGTILERGYFSHPFDIIKIWEGGLASHGGAMAILIALWIYSKRVSKKPMMWILDRIAAPIAIGGTFIRLGNLVNSEIVGNPTDVAWGFQFMHHDCPLVECDWAMVPVRHPAQLYESLFYLSIFAVLMYMFWKRKAWRRQGVMFGAFLIMLFGARFLVEFVKLGQADRDMYLPINTGQILSIPFILAGVYILWKGLKRTPIEEMGSSKTEGSTETQK